MKTNKLNLSAEAAELRQRAEKQFRAKTDTTSASTTDDVTQRLLHELQVHQIELEMQNAELRQARDEAEAAFEKYSELYDFAPVGYFTLDSDGVIHAANLTGASLIETERTCLIGQQFGLFISPRNRAAFSAFLERVFICRGKETCELEFTKAGKQPLYLQIEAVASASTGECRIAVIDSTARKEAETVLMESEKRYSTLFNNQHVVMLVTNPETGMILNANPAARTFYGYNLEQFTALKISDITLLPPLDIMKYIEQALNADTSPLHCRHRLANNGIRDVEVYSALIEYKKQKLIYSIVHDVTQRRQAEEALKSLNEELDRRVTERTAELADTIRKLRAEIDERLRAEKALREKELMLIHQSRQAALGEMIGNIAHQWRQPLNTLGLVVQQLPLLYECGEFTKEYLDKSVAQSMNVIQHMSQTIDDFRNYFLPDREKVEFMVSEVIAQTVVLIEDSFKDQKIDIEVLTQDSPAIQGYRNEFAQALLNILNNARDALSERAIAVPKVTISIGCEDGKAVVTISDNAGGIPNEILSKVFDPYFTTKGPDKGSGIGLFMSKTIIEKNMGGSLTARNTGEGAEFRIEV